MIRSNLPSGAQEIYEWLQGALNETHQQRQFHIAMAGGIAAGCLIWSILPGLVARALPESWHLPERMARRTVGEPSLWEAGDRMMRAENAEPWAFVIGAAEIRHQNRDAIAACEKKADKAKRATRCSIRLGGYEN